jgi:hypothetical protein
MAVCLISRCQKIIISHHGAESHTELQVLFPNVPCRKGLACSVKQSGQQQRENRTAFGLLRNFYGLCQLHFPAVKFNERLDSLKMISFPDKH